MCLQVLCFTLTLIFVVDVYQNQNINNESQGECENPNPGNPNQHAFNLNETSGSFHTFRVSRGEIKKRDLNYYFYLLYSTR